MFKKKAFRKSFKKTFASFAPYSNRSHNTFSLHFGSAKDVRQNVFILSTFALILALSNVFENISKTLEFRTKAFKNPLSSAFFFSRCALQDEKPILAIYRLTVLQNRQYFVGVSHLFRPFVEEKGENARSCLYNRQNRLNSQSHRLYNPLRYSLALCQSQQRNIFQQQRNIYSLTSALQCLTSACGS